MPRSRRYGIASLDAPDVLFQTYGPRCYALALRILRDQQLAEDVVQDVFADVCARPERYDPDRGSVATWLLTITHHKAVDTVRWRHRRVALDVPDAFLGLLRDISPSPEEDACSSDARASVRAALLEIPATQRQVLLWAHYGGYTQREIAAGLEIPIGTVKSRTVAGMRRLQQQLATLAR